MITAPATVSSPESTPIAFTVTAADPDGDAITSFTGSGTAMLAGGTFTTNFSNTSGTFNWTPTSSQAGSYSVTFTASNALSGSSTTNITVTPFDRAPVVAAPALVTARVGELLSFTVSAADPDGEAITSLTASGTAMTAGATFTANASFTSGTFTWTPGFTHAGTYSATFTATNALSGSDNTTITVCECDRAPVVTAPAAITGSRNVLLTFTASAADPDGDAITQFSASLLPPGATFTANATFTSGTFNWTPTDAQNGTYNVTFIASNSLSGSATTHITVGSSDRAPVVTAPSTVSSPEGSSITFTVTAADPDGDAIASLTASGTAIAAGGTFTAGAGNTSGTFSWASAPRGTYGVTFTAFSNGLSGTATTQITVSGSGFTARAFTVGANKAIRLNSGKPRWCAFVEPVGESFSIMNIDLASVRLRYPVSGTGEIPAQVSKAVVVGDVDNNNVMDVQFCFAKEDLRTLFSSLHGKNTVTVAITGSLITGGSFEATLDVNVIAGGGSLAASISPNPLNPTGTITFSTPTSGLARVRIFDASGRLVRTVVETSLQAGRHDLPLDVRDGSDRRPSSGVYFYKVEVAGEVATGRFVVTR